MSEEKLLEPKDIPLDCLLHAVQNVSTGCIDVFERRESIGQIVVSEGRIAWATCRGQSETLGVFLWRLGRISREQLSQIQMLFKQYKGSKKLGALLEEQGFMNRPLLRRCLLLHTRSAIERLLSYPNAKALWTSGNYAADETILFGPEEVLPDDFSTDIVSEWTCPENTWVRSWRKKTSENAILEPLFSLPGHLASAVVTADGEIISAHVSDASITLNLVAVFVAAMLESSSRVVSVSSLNSVELIALECNKGSLYVRWLDDKHSRMIFVLVGKQGNPYLTRYSLNLCAPLIDDWLTKGGGGERRKAISMPLFSNTSHSDSPRDVATLIAEAKRLSLTDIFPAVSMGELAPSSGDFSASQASDDKNDVIIPMPEEKRESKS